MTFDATTPDQTHSVARTAGQEHEQKMASKAKKQAESDQNTPEVAKRPA